MQEVAKSRKKWQKVAKIRKKAAKSLQEATFTVKVSFFIT